MVDLFYLDSALSEIVPKTRRGEKISDRINDNRNINPLRLFLDQNVLNLLTQRIAGKNKTVNENLMPRASKKLKHDVIHFLSPVENGQFVSRNRDLLRNIRHGNRLNFFSSAEMPYFFHLFPDNMKFLSGDFFDDLFFHNGHVARLVPESYFVTARERNPMF